MHCVNVTVAAGTTGVGTRPEAALQRQRGHVPVDPLRHARPVQRQGAHLHRHAAQDAEKTATQAVGWRGRGGEGSCISALFFINFTDPV